MLRDGRLATADTAVALGFADQSPFTTMFRRMTATTSSRYCRYGALDGS